MGWKYVQSRAGCCECRPNEYFCSLDCWGISGVSSKTGFWYLELIWFTVVSFNLVYLIGWLLTQLVILSVCLFVCQQTVTYRFILYKRKGGKWTKRRIDEREWSVTENQPVIMRKFFSPVDELMMCSWYHQSFYRRCCPSCVHSAGLLPSGVQPCFKYSQSRSGASCSICAHSKHCGKWTCSRHGRKTRRVP